jgi:membrane protease YdiL (CAAX protease family)
MINEIGGGITTGLFFIYLQEKSGTLWVPVLIHALLDYSYLFFGQLIAIVILIYYIMTSKYVKK